MRTALLSALAIAIAFAACSSDDAGNKKSKANEPSASKRAAGLPTGTCSTGATSTNHETQAEIYAVGTGETNGRSITQPLPAGYADDLAVASPDGSRMILTRCAERCLLFTAAIDGSGLKRLSPECCADENSASYSGDGRTLVFGRAWGAVKHGRSSTPRCSA